MPSDVDEASRRVPSIVGRIWVTGTCGLIGFLAYSSQLVVIVPSYASLFDPALLVRIVPFNLLLGLLWWNYALCVRTDPGAVPRGWSPDLDPQSDGVVEVKRLSGRPRFCRSCNAYKPPRAHHCRQCKRCVLRMDHHNCVGQANYGHFVRFLFYVDVCTAMHLWLISSLAFGTRSYYLREPSTTWLVTLIMNYVLCVPVVVAVGGFSLYHFYCLASNQTTIEGWEKDKVATLRRRGHIHDVKYPYDLGFTRNISSVLGPSALWWCWPHQAYGDGLSYPTSAGVAMQSELCADGAWVLRRVFASTRRESFGSGLDLRLTSHEDPREQYAWPPRDETRQLSRSFRQPSGPAFTYGDDLNPALRSRRPSDQAVTDEDDVPLATLATRVRRGSEGYEVRSLDARARASLVDEDRRPRKPPWMVDDGSDDDRTARYRTYDPRADDDDDSASVSSFDSL